MRAELADGRVLEFPDGTDPAVVQRTVKGLLAKDKEIPGEPEAVPVPKGKTRLNPLQQKAGIAESGLSLLTGIAGGAVGSVAGLVEGLMPDNYGTREGGERAQARAAEVARSLTYQPRNESGQIALSRIGDVIESSKLEGLGPTLPLSAVSKGTPKSLKPRVPYSEITPPEVPAKVKLPYSAADAAADGFVTTPRQARPGSITADVVEGLSGSAKMEKLASIKNQKNVNRLVAEDLGLDPAKPITVGDLEAVRKTEGAAYKAIKESGVALKADDAFKKAVSDLGGDFKAATNELEGLVDQPKIDALIKSLSVDKMSANAAVEATRYLRSQSTKNLKAGFADPEKAALGMAQRNAANALDDLIENNLSQAGKGDLAEKYRAARVKIAKAHSAEAALNEATGNIDPNYLAKLADKTQLSGGMEKVAAFNKAFKGSARNVDTMKDASNFSLADVALAGAAHLSTGNLLGLTAVGARPAARSIALSKLGQKMVVPSLEEASKMSPETARMKLIKLSELASDAAANDPNINALITVLSDRAEQGRK